MIDENAHKVTIRLGIGVRNWRMTEESRQAWSEFIEWWGPEKRRSERDLMIACAIPAAIAGAAIGGIVGFALMLARF